MYHLTDELYLKGKPLEALALFDQARLASHVGVLVHTARLSASSCAFTGGQADVH
ncbi:MAG: hypothetical protein HC911_16020 [Chloroflexaceae bacterium]|nr:hypothetical protein [Chloroflexaceae bacterium]